MRKTTQQRFERGNSIIKCSYLRFPYSEKIGRSESEARHAPGGRGRSQRMTSSLAYETHVLLTAKLLNVRRSREPERSSRLRLAEDGLFPSGLSGITSYPCSTPAVFLALDMIFGLPVIGEEPTGMCELNRSIMDSRNNSSFLTAFSYEKLSAMGSRLSS